VRYSPWNPEEVLKTRPYAQTLVKCGISANGLVWRERWDRAVKMGVRAGTGAVLGAVTSGAAYGIRQLLKKRRIKRRS